MRFITHAIEGNHAEVQMGQLAQEKGMSDGVRAYGQILQQDHLGGSAEVYAVATPLVVMIRHLSPLSSERNQ